MNMSSHTAVIHHLKKNLIMNEDYIISQNADKLSTEKTNHKYFKRKVGDCKQRIIT